MPDGESAGTDGAVQQQCPDGIACDLTDEKDAGDFGITAEQFLQDTEFGAEPGASAGRLQQNGESRTAEQGRDQCIETERDLF